MNQMRLLWQSTLKQARDANRWHGEYIQEVAPSDTSPENGQESSCSRGVVQEDDFGATILSLFLRLRTLDCESAAQKVRASHVSAQVPAGGLIMKVQKLYLSMTIPFSCAQLRPTVVERRCD